MRATKKNAARKTKTPAAPLPSPRPTDVVASTHTILDYLVRVDPRDRVRVVKSVGALLGLELYEGPEDRDAQR